MSETIKKKPDFKDLDFSKIGAASAPKVPEKVESTSSTKDGIWICGIPLNEVSNEDFKAWLSNLLPGVGIDKWDNSIITSQKDREKIILRLSQQLQNVFGLRKSIVEKKKYLN